MVISTPAQKGQRYWLFAPQSLGGRMVLATLFFCLIFTVLAVAVRTWSAWQFNRNAMDAELALIEQVYRQTLTKTIWEMDKESLQTHLNSAAKIPAVGQISVKITPANRAPEISSRTQPGWQPSTLAPTRQLLLTYQAYAGAPQESVGELALAGDERVLWARLRGEIVAIVATQVIQSLLLAGFIMLIFNRSVTVHVQRIAHHLSRLGPDNLRRTLSLQRSSAHPDELSMLVTGVNLLQSNWLDHLQQQQRYESELKEHRDHLSELVTERTAELSAANNALASSANTLRQLGDIGKDLTASLDQRAICLALYHQLDRLLPLDAFGVAVLGSAGDRLELIYYIEDGVVAGKTTFMLDHPTSLTVRAFLEERELILVDEAQAAGAPIPAGIVPNAPIRSAVLRPLVVNAQRIGVVVVQSHQADAYHERELEVVRSAAAYAAIALANASAYGAAQAAREQTAAALDELRQTQTRLVQQEKLAALGQLVAGVAHEINTPVGIAISGASQLKRELIAARQLFEQGQLKKSGLHDLLDLGSELSALVLANTQRAGQLIGSFKQVAVDQVSETCRQLDLKEYAEEVLRTLEPLLKHSGVAVSLQGDEKVPLHTYPGPLAQVLTNLVQNAVLHAFAGVAQPEIQIRLSTGQAGQATLLFHDNGVGMQAETRQRAFEPFFSTKRNQGGTGLGLHIVHNLVVGPLNGEITLDSAPGQGTSFNILLRNSAADPA